MKMSEGVEWAIHSCTVLCGLPPAAAFSARHLATLFDLPAPYLAKILQQLAAADILRTKRGRKGGYTLARDPRSITLLAIVEALEGRSPLFRCTELRQRGPCAASGNRYTRPCGIARALWSAERAWRAELAATSLAALAERGLAEAPPEQIERSIVWVTERLK